jgi:hypothetical protein
LQVVRVEDMDNLMAEDMAVVVEAREDLERQHRLA